MLLSVFQCLLLLVGFTNLVPTKKGLYIDGHEREDVVEYRKLYLRKLEALEAKHRPPPPVSGEHGLDVSSPMKCLVLLSLIIRNKSAYYACMEAQHKSFPHDSSIRLPGNSFVLWAGV